MKNSKEFWKGTNTSVMRFLMTAQHFRQDQKLYGISDKVHCISLFCSQIVFQIA